MKSKLLILVICLVLMLGCENGEREDFFDLKGNKISELEFKLDGENGTIVAYHKNGNKKVSVTLVDGDPIREVKWYANGVKKVVREYTESFSDWKEITWYRNGKKKYETEYKNGKEHGKSIYWYENGQKESEGQYFEEHFHGKWIWWYKNGKMWALQEFKYGKPHGKYITWDKNGQKTREAYFKDGNLIRENSDQ